MASGGSYHVPLVVITVAYDIMGWEQSGHGLSSRPEESADHLLLNALLEIFGYHAGSAQELLAGYLKLRYCKLQLRAGAHLEGSLFWSCCFPCLPVPRYLRE